MSRTKIPLDKWLSQGENRLMKLNSSIIPQNYNLLLEECREIITEYEFTSRWALVEGYHELGKKIVELPPVTVTKLATDLHKNERTLRRARQFFQKYPDLNMLPEGKNCSWHSICNKYLPETTSEKKIIYMECPKCHYQWEK